MIANLNREQTAKLAGILAERFEDRRSPSITIGHPEGEPGAFRSITLSEGRRVSVFALNLYGEIVPTPAQLSIARREGRAMGEAVGTWAATSDTPQETIRAILKAWEEGDPDLLDLLPEIPTLSGEWADECTPIGLASDILDLDGGLIDDIAIDALSETSGGTSSPGCSTSTPMRSSAHTEEWSSSANITG